MSNGFKSVQIEDIQADNIDPKTREHLTDLFIYAVRSMAPTLIREAGFHTDDFATARQRNCAGYALHITRQTENGMTSWHGTFTRENQRL
ncbi:MAG: hypothetical protein ACE5ED_12500 [Rhodothalassiaceae bacterium]